MNFSNLHILVLGDVFLDEYQFGDCTRISPEAPVPIVQIDHTRTKQMPGGAGNVVANILSLGASCSFGTKMGLDSAGMRLSDMLVKRGAFPIFAYPDQYRTPVKTRIVAQNQQVVRLDQEKNPRNNDIGIERILAHIKHCDAVILSDYAKGYFTRWNAEEIIVAAKALGKLVVVDTKPSNAEFFKGADWVTPNWSEYVQMIEHGPMLFDNMLITKGSLGMECRQGGLSGLPFSVPAIQREVVDVAGAGDTVVAAFTLALAAKVPLKEAVEFANKAAGVVVGKQGTSVVTVEEIEAFEKNIHGLRAKDAA